MTVLLAIDPGGYDSKEKSTGVVWFDLSALERAAADGRPLSASAPIRTASMRGQDLFQILMDESLRPDVVYEGYHTFPGFAGSTMNEHKIAETCGLIRAACDYRGLSHKKQWSSAKPHASKWCESRGIVLVGTNAHQRDAELHGWWYIRNLGGA